MWNLKKKKNSSQDSELPCFDPGNLTFISFCTSEFCLEFQLKGIALLKRERKKNLENLWLGSNLTW
jgi:hypothetical protein